VVSIPRGVLYGATLAICGLVAWAFTTPRFGAGLVALGVVWMMRGFQEGANDE
jgi:hypothetical protein